MEPKVDEPAFQFSSEANNGVTFLVSDLPDGSGVLASLTSGVTSRARGSRWARSEMTRAVGTLPGWPGRG